MPTIGLYNIQIGDTGATALSEALKVNSTVTYIGLGKNKIGDAAKENLREICKSKNIELFI